MVMKIIAQNTDHVKNALAYLAANSSRGRAHLRLPISPQKRHDHQPNGHSQNNQKKSWLAGIKIPEGLKRERTYHPHFPG